MKKIDLKKDEHSVEHEKMLQARINEILEQENKNGQPIVSLKLQEKPVAHRIFIGLFETAHCELSLLPLKLAYLLATGQPDSVLCLEGPLNQNARLIGGKELSFEDQDYNKNVSGLYLALKGKSEMVFMDDLEFKKTGQGKKYFKKYFKSLESIFEKDSDRALDRIRNEIMTQVITAYTSKKYVFAINGLMHGKDLLTQLSQTGCFDVRVSVIVNSSSSQSLTVKLVEQSSGPCLMVSGNNSVPLTKEFQAAFFKALRDLIRQLKSKQSQSVAKESQIESKPGPSSIMPAYQAHGLPAAGKQLAPQERSQPAQLSLNLQSPG